jgi:hypothetical protein
MPASHPYAMNSTLLASATARSANMRRIQKVARTSDEAR